MKFRARSALSIQPRPTFSFFSFSVLDLYIASCTPTHAGHINLYKLVGTRPSSRREKDEERKKGKKTGGKFRQTRDRPGSLEINFFYLFLPLCLSPCLVSVCVCVFLFISFFKCVSPGTESLGSSKFKLRCLTGQKVIQ